MKRNTFVRLLFITLLSCFGTAQADSSMPPENGTCLADSFIRVTSNLALLIWPDNGAPAYRVERRRIDHSAFEVLATTPHLIGGYIDQAVELFVTYEYRIGALDEQGSIVCWSPMLHATPTPRHPPKLPPVINSQPPETALVDQFYTYAIDATDPNNMPLTYRLDQSPIGMSLDTQTGIVEWLPSQNQIGSHPITVTVIDIAGHTARQSFDIAVTEPEDNSVTLPPNPEDVAPPLIHASASVQEQTAFLYTGNNPIQTGVSPNTIEERRAAVVRGQVLDRSNNPLSGVTITIKGRTEYGQTLSRQDGWFDMAVNGGGMLIVNYEKTGFLPVQRQVHPQWNAFAFAEDVVMIPLDAQVTTVQLGNGAPMQVAQGSPQTDAEGTRQATVLFPQGTTATMRLPNGSTQALTTLNVRATEYTVGENGFEAMPGPLPPTSAYTYAVELSVDEAIAAGASRVDFNQPVPLYVDNFLNFPTGEIVPAGYYDFDDAVWKAGDNGRVIEILSIENGLAVLDINGQGQSATEDELLELGINTEELQTLATLYTAGSTLWRTPISHFTPWDCNWPYGPPLDAERPNVPVPETLNSNHPDNSNEEDECGGCVISPQRQTLGESLPIAGTPFELTYRSDRTQGYLNNIADIALTGDSVPASLKSIRLTVDIAGRRFIRYFSKMPNQQHRFEWDGFDVYGREVFGTRKATININYLYPCVYYGANSSIVRAWAQMSNNISVIGTRVDCHSMVLAQSFSVEMTSPHQSIPNSVGDWSLNNHHAYNPTNSMLLLGNGNRRANTGHIIDTIAGSGSTGGPGVFAGDGGPATSARLAGASGVAVDASGNIYIADTNNHRIRRVSPNGIIETVAGDGSIGLVGTGIIRFSGDGGLATNARLSSPNGVAVDAAGNIYIADTGNHRIRRVSPNGIIETVAGRGLSPILSGNGIPAVTAYLHGPTSVAVDNLGNLYIADSGSHRIRRVNQSGIIETVAGSGPGGNWQVGSFSGDGGPATEARLYSPNGVTVDDAGNLFIVDSRNHRIRRVSPSGIIDTIAGTSTAGYSGDSSQATEAELKNPTGIVVDSAGNVYIADTGNHRIRRVSQDGIINTVAGTGSSGFSGDGGSATSAHFRSLFEISLDANDNLYIADSGNKRIRRVKLNTLTTPTAEGEIQIASTDGTQLFHFDRYGQHLKTTDTVTGVVLYTFDYDAENLLSTVTDQHGNITRIERNGLGHATAIIAPQGQRTELTINANGHLVRLSNPNGESWHMNYTSKGLLTRFETPNGHINTFNYDVNGRLVRDIAPNGGGWQIFRTELEKGYTTSMISGEGRASHFTTEQGVSGQRIYTNEAPDGSITERRHTDSETILVQPNGTQITSTQTPDPRFGMHAPVTSQSITTPSGLMLNQTTERSAELENTNDALSHTALTTTVTLNDRVQTSVYDTATRTWTHTSPEGRTLTQRLNELGLLSEARVEGLANVHYQYNNQGRLTHIARGPNNERAVEFGYDTLGYLASLTDALGKTVHYENDAVGRVQQQTFPNGSTVDYDYDPNGNLTEIRLSSGDVHRFAYTPVDQQETYSPPNPNDSQTDAPLGNGHPTTHYQYNRDKQLEALTRPDGTVVDFGYNTTTGQLTELVIPEGRYDFAYYGAQDAVHSGQLKTLTAPGGLQTAYEYDGFLLTGTSWSGPVSGALGYEYNHYFEPTRQLLNGVAVDWQFNADS
ncbi:putative Ig domain-containing protein, partial [Salinispirillum marinum]